jgi:spore germination cell wall hydrolase CwlJ-like protein
MLILILLLICSPVYAEIPKEVYCVIGEAEGEGYEGMLAVSEAIRNRGKLSGVFGCRSPRVVGHKYNNKTLNLAIKAWSDSKGSNDITKGATHWEGTAFKTPYWAKDMILTATIGNQRFYKEKQHGQK